MPGVSVFFFFFGRDDQQLPVAAGSRLAAHSISAVHGRAWHSVEPFVTFKFSSPVTIKHGRHDTIEATQGWEEKMKVKTRRMRKMKPKRAKLKNSVMENSQKRITQMF